MFSTISAALRKQWETVGVMALLLVVMLGLVVMVEPHFTVFFNIDAFQHGAIIGYVLIGVIAYPTLSRLYIVLNVVITTIGKEMNKSFSKWNETRQLRNMAIADALKKSK